MKKNYDCIQIIKPDDWHVHLREGDILKTVINYSTRINSRCIVMPNLKNPITSSQIAKDYLNTIKVCTENDKFRPLIPCYLTDTLDLDDFNDALKKNLFIGAKLYPTNTTTNSKLGVSKIENIFPALEILENNKKPLLIHGEKINDKISIFDREKYFIDDNLTKIINYFPSLKVILEHVSSKYGADFVNENINMAGTITPHHMLLTKKDVYKNDNINSHHYCMPIVKNEYDLIALRKYACSGNSKFFLGTDSAPHEIKYKENTENVMPGIFSAPCSIELYATIFEEENSLNNLEKFSSINGPNFYNLSINKEKINMIKCEWTVEEYTIYKDIKIKNFWAGKKINWKIQN